MGWIRRGIFLIVMAVVMVACGTSDRPAKELCDKKIEEALAAIDARDYRKSITILLQVRDKAEECGWGEQYFLSLNYLARCYYEVNDYNESIGLLLSAYDFARKKLPKRFELKALNNLSILYCEEKQYGKAQEAFTEIYRYGIAEKDSVVLCAAAANLAKIEYIKGDYAKAKRYVKVVEGIKDSADYGHVVQAMLVYADILIAEGKLTEAENTVESICCNEGRMRNSTSSESIRMRLAKIADKRKDYGKAAEYALQALAIAGLEEKGLAYGFLSDVSYKSGDLKRALEYKDSALVARDSLYAQKSKLFEENNRIRADLISYRGELERQRMTMRMERIAFFVVLGLLAVIVWRERVKFRQRRIMTEQQNLISHLELEAARDKEIILRKELKESEMREQIEKEKLRNEIEFQNRKLASKALSLSNNSQFVKETIDFISDIPEIKGNAKYAGYIQNLRMKLKCEDEAEDFLMYFEKINTRFMNAIHERHPDLSANDIRYISYVYVGLNTKEIASLLNITVDASKKRKQRISSKLGLENTTDLYSYLSEL